MTTYLQSELRGAAGLASEEAAIVTSLRNAIFERRLAPGSKLREEHLAETYSTTRARVRRVLLALAQERIVILEPGRGASVAHPTPDEAMDVLAARRTLEVGIVERPQRPLPADSYDRLVAIIADEREAHQRNDTVGMIRSSGQFHLELALGLANRVVASMLYDLIMRSSLIISIYERQTGLCCLTVDHDILLAAVRSGSSSDAARLMARHILEIEQNMDLVKPAPVARTRRLQVGVA